MNKKNRRISEMATRMNGFLTAQDGAFPPNTIGGQRFTELGELVGKIDQLGSKQAQDRGSARAATESKKARREEIRRRMKEVRETAPDVGGQQPGNSRNFLMPASKSDESLIEAARAFVAAATPLKPLFLSREMPENFLEALGDAIQSFEEAVNVCNLHRAGRAAAGSLLDDTCLKVVALRRELDPIVRNRYRNDPERLALWETASHLEKPAKKGAAAKPDGASAPPAGG